MYSDQPPFHMGVDLNTIQKRKEHSLFWGNFLHTSMVEKVVRVLNLVVPNWEIPPPPIHIKFLYKIWGEPLALPIIPWEIIYISLICRTHVFKQKLEWGCPNGTKIPPAATHSNSPSYAPDRGSSYAPETLFSNPCIVTLTFDLLTPKSIGSIIDSWGDCILSFMKIGVKGKQLCARNLFQ